MPHFFKIALLFQKRSLQTLVASWQSLPAVVQAVTAVVLSLLAAMHTAPDCGSQTAVVLMLLAAMQTAVLTMLLATMETAPEKSATNTHYPFLGSR